jgi:hypothetical protein
MQINKCVVHANNDAYCCNEDRNTCRILAGNADVTDQWEDLDADRIILEWCLKQWDGNAQSGAIWLGIETSGRL